MARLDYIHHESCDAVLDGSGQVLWTRTANKEPIERLPQIYWEDHRGWVEANVWAADRAASGTVGIETITRSMKYLCGFASFIEAEGIDWRHFPVRKEKQVLRKFRKHLIEEVDNGMLASTTASNCMCTVIQFYRYADLHNLVGAEAAMWSDRLAVIPFHDGAGYKRAMVRLSSDLSIPNRKRVGHRLEDGLIPLRAEHMCELCKYTSEYSTEELHLMLSCGFFSGARIGTITTMTVSGLLTAREDPHTLGVFLLPVGPKTGIATKFSVDGDLMVPREVLDDLIRYAFSTKRLLREAKARPEHKNLLFLTRRSRPYTVGTVDRLVQELRRQAVAAGMRFMTNFKFHQSRATFGTWLMQLLLSNGVNTTDAIGFVRDAMLHKDEQTTLGYIKFLENTRAKQHVAAAFNMAFTGLQSKDWENERALTSSATRPNLP
ncbi:integrase [Paraburkholderia youngii]|uniref:site-specific integrase n=1 Tax=Paraburkholderia youngii TaxID=2782701 RepID=UPI003D19402C